jgi:peptidoglycan hydrolase-like protein with peptidoglycan-binding domain/uncharacterized protein (UPF0332 family)
MNAQYKILTIPAVLSLVVASIMLATTSTAYAGTCTFTQSFDVGDVNEEIRCLQVYLNDSGYLLTSNGAGSPGKETDKYGGLTKAAVADWQRANDISPSSGYFGPVSRAAYERLTAQTSNTGTASGNTSSNTSNTTSNQVSATQNQLDSELRALLKLTMIQVEATAGVINDAQDDDMDVDEAQKLMSRTYVQFFDAINAYLDGSYTNMKDDIEKTLSLTKEAAESVGDADKSNSKNADEDDAKDAIDDAEDEIKDAEDDIDDAKDDGKDVEDAEDALKDAEDTLEDAEKELAKEDWKDAIKDAEEAIELAKEAVEAIGESEFTEDKAKDAIEDAEDAIDDAQDAIDDADEDGEDVRDAEDELDKAEDKLKDAEDEYDDEDWEQAIEDAEDAIRLAEDAEDEL